MEKQTKNTEFMQENRTTASAIAEEVRVLVKDEFVCKECIAEENGFALSLCNGQKFRISVAEL